MKYVPIGNPEYARDGHDTELLLEHIRIVVLEKENEANVTHRQVAEEEILN